MSHTHTHTKIQMHIVESENTITKRKCSTDRFKSKFIIAEQNINKLKGRSEKYLDRSTDKERMQIGRKRV